MDSATKQEFREIVREEVDQAINNAVKPLVTGQQLQEFGVVIRGEIKPLSERMDELENVMSLAFSELEQNMDQRFERMDQRFEQVDQRFERMDQRFEQVDQRFVRLENIIGKWPAPSTIDRLLERTGIIEKHIGIRSV